MLFLKVLFGIGVAILRGVWIFVDPEQVALALQMGRISDSTVALVHLIFIFMVIIFSLALLL